MNTFGFAADVAATMLPSHTTVQATRAPTTRRSASDAEADFVRRFLFPFDTALHAEICSFCRHVLSRESCSGARF